MGEVENKDIQRKKYTGPNSLCRGVLCAFIFIEIYILTHNISSGVIFYSFYAIPLEIRLV